MGFAAPRCLALLLPLCLPAACGGGEAGNAKAGASVASADNVYSPMEAVFRPDGTVDRALHRRNDMIACRRSLSRNPPPQPSADAVEHYCGCLADRLGVRSDHELRVSISARPEDQAEQRRLMDQISAECGPPPTGLE